jgi:hypothetical protein
MLIIDNFLPDEEFKQLQTAILGPDFPWYFMSTVSRPAGSYVPPGAMETHGFHHTFYSSIDNNKSWTIGIVGNLLEKINAYENGTADFIRVRASLKTHKKGFTDQHYNIPHVDYHFPHISAVYYINESDGDTWMFNEEFKQFPEPDVFTVKQRVNPKPNRLIIFDGLCYHTASNPINSDSRVIININYKKIV